MSAVTQEQQVEIIALVDEILAAKKDYRVKPDNDTCGADTSEAEREIEGKVYALYGLRREEIAAVEGK